MSGSSTTESRSYVSCPTKSHCSGFSWTIYLRINGSRLLRRGGLLRGGSLLRGGRRALAFALTRGSSRSSRSSRSGNTRVTLRTLRSRDLGRTAAFADQFDHLEERLVECGLVHTASRHLLFEF